MKETGQIVLLRFPQTDLEEGKLRPALLLGKMPGEYDCTGSKDIGHKGRFIYGDISPR